MKDGKKIIGGKRNPLDRAIEHEKNGKEFIHVVRRLLKIRINKKFFYREGKVMTIIDNNKTLNMVECQECGHMRSDKENICPKCGSKKKLHRVFSDIKVTPMNEESDDKLLDQLKKDIEKWEGKEIEFIEDFPKIAHELTKEMAAFSTSNYGRIYLGINKNKEIIGLKNIDDIQYKDGLINRLANLSQGSVKPAIIVTTHFIDIGNSKAVLRINVPKGVEPVYFSNDIPYIRNLATSGHATSDQVKELHRQYFLKYGLSEKKLGRLSLRFRLGISERVFLREVDLHTDEITGEVTDKEDVRKYELFMKNIETYSVADIRFKIHNHQFSISYLDPGKEQMIYSMKEDKIRMDSDGKIFIYIEDLIYTDIEGNRLCVKAIPAGLYEYIFPSEIANLAIPKICDKD